jgi:hypothetical protein
VSSGERFSLANLIQKMHTFRDFCSRLYLDRYARPAILKATQFGSVLRVGYLDNEAFEIFG